MDKIIFPGFLRSFFTNFRNILFPSCRALNNLLKFWGHALRPLVIILAVPLSIGFVLLDFNYSAVAYPEVFWGIPLVSKITRFSVTRYWFRADLYFFFFFFCFSIFLSARIWAPIRHPRIGHWLEIRLVLFFFTYLLALCGRKIFFSLLYYALLYWVLRGYECC